MIDHDDAINSQDGTDYIMGGQEDRAPNITKTVGNFESSDVIKQSTSQESCERSANDKQDQPSAGQATAIQFYNSQESNAVDSAKSDSFDEQFSKDNSSQNID